MPAVSIYLKGDQKDVLKAILHELRSFIAKTLSGEARQLTPEEVSLRLIPIEDGLMISSVEIEIKAYSYPARVQAQDEICRGIADFIKNQNSSLQDVHVWLQLSELGHSWEE